jgi:FtsZ-binding cell division protein ZapB
MAQPPPTVRDTLKIRIKRLKERKQRAQADVADLQGQIDALQAELDALTPAEETKLERLQVLAVIRAED